MANKQTQSTELTAIEQPEFVELVKNSGLELTKAETYALGYAPLMMKVREQTDIIKGLDKSIPEHGVLAKQASVQLGHICSELEDKKDEDKKYIRIEDKLIQGLYNVAESTARLGQKDAKEIFTYQEQLIRAKQEQLKNTRIALLEPFEVDIEYLPLDIMTEDRFADLLSKSKESFEAVKKQREQAEKERVEAEKLAEATRLAEIEVEKQRQIERDKENERLKKEAEIKDVRTKELMPLLIMIRDFDGMVAMPEDEYQKELAEIKIGYQQHLEYQYDQAKKEEERVNTENKAREKEMQRLELEAKKQQKEASEKQAELDSLAKELQAVKDREEKERQDAIAEQQEKEAAEKAKRLAPDKEKINALYIQIRDFSFPECESDEAKVIITEIQEGFKIILEGIKTKSQTLK